MFEASHQQRALFCTVHLRSLILSWKLWGKYRKHKEQRRSCCRT